MVFNQVLATFHALFDVIGLPGNLLVTVVIVLEKRFHVMRNILLASLAMSDVLCLILVNSFRIASVAHEKWLYGEKMCFLNLIFARYFYCNTVLHLVAVSYERYRAIVKSPLTYDGRVTKTKVALIVLIWFIPIAVTISSFLGFEGRLKYNSEIFFCEQEWSEQEGSNKWKLILIVNLTFVAPFLVISFLNWSVYKTAKSQINALHMPAGSVTGSESRQRELSRRKRERMAAIDVSIIIAAFLLCNLPMWIVHFARQFVESIKVPSEAAPVASAIFMANCLCNPIIYSIRKRDFRARVRTLFRRIGIRGNIVDAYNNENVRSDLWFVTIHDSRASTSSPAEALPSQYQDERLDGSTEITRLNFQRFCLSPIVEVDEEHWLALTKLQQ